MVCANGCIENLYHFSSFAMSILDLVEIEYLNPTDL